MGNGSALADAMDSGVARVLSRTERAYDVAIETAGLLTEQIGSSQEAASTGAAYVLWAEVGDLVDAPNGPRSEVMCEDFAVHLAEAWQATDDRANEAVQTAFIETWSGFLAAYWRTGNLPDRPC